MVFQPQFCTFSVPQFAHQLHEAKTTYLARHCEDQKEHTLSNHLYLRPPLISKGFLTKRNYRQQSCLTQLFMSNPHHVFSQGGSVFHTDLRSMRTWTEVTGVL